MGNEIEFAWKGKDYISLSELFDELNAKKVIIAVDEAQLLEGAQLYRDEERHSAFVRL